MAETRNGGDQRRRAAQLAKKLEERAKAEAARPEVQRFYEAGVVIARAVANGEDLKSETFRVHLTTRDNLIAGMVAAVSIALDGETTENAKLECMSKCGSDFQACVAGGGGTDISTEALVECIMRHDRCFFGCI